MIPIKFYMISYVTMNDIPVMNTDQNFFPSIRKYGIGTVGHQLTSINSIESIHKIII